jgi:hypothetical protein
VTASDDKTCRIWNAGKTTRILSGHTDAITGVSWSPDGTRLLTSSKDTYMKLFDPVSGEKLRTFRGHRESVTGCHWSPDSAIVVSVSSDSHIIFWNQRTTDQLQVYTDPDVNVLTCVRWSPDGRFIAVGEENGSICIWDVLNNSVKAVLKAHKAKVNALTWSPDSKPLLISGGDDGSLFLWEVEGVASSSPSQPDEQKAVLQKIAPIKKPLKKAGSKKGKSVIMEVEEEEDEVNEKKDNEIKHTSSLKDSDQKEVAASPDEEQEIRVTAASNSHSKASIDSVKAKPTVASVTFVDDEKTEEANTALKGSVVKFGSVFNLDDKSVKLRTSTAEELQEEIERLAVEQKENTSQMQTLVEESESLATNLETSKEELHKVQKKLGVLEDAAKSSIIALAKLLFGLLLAQIVYDMLFNMFGFVTTYPLIFGVLYYAAKHAGMEATQRYIKQSVIPSVIQKPVPVIASFLVYFVLPMLESAYFIHRIVTDAILIGSVLLEVKDSSLLVSSLQKLLTTTKEKQT